MTTRTLVVKCVACLVVVATWVLIIAVLFLMHGCEKPQPTVVAELGAKKSDASVAVEEPTIGAALQARANLPRDAEKWRGELTRAARLEWGLNAPVATFGAQIHQESSWRADAVSPVGAQGLAQFMPATATWLAGAKASVGPADALNPVWALRALAAYDKTIWDGVAAVDACNRGAKMLSGYNGGPGWVARDERLAIASGLDAHFWWGAVEIVNAGRSEAAWQENRTYPKRILRKLEPMYLAAGWGEGLCNVM